MAVLPLTDDVSHDTAILVYTRLARMSTIPTMNKLMRRLSMQKRVDMSVSIDITSLANCRVRDTNGNLLATVWTRRSINNKYDNATLLTRDALQKHFQAFLDKNIDSNSETLVRLIARHASGPSNTGNSAVGRD
jgi:hypothetical protein